MKAMNSFLLAILALGAFSCAPVFSTLQSAKLVGKGNFEATPHFTTTSSKEEGESDHIQNHFGFQVGYGLSKGVDLIARYENIVISNEGGNANVFGIGPKINLVRDMVAAYIPVGFAFGQDIGGIEQLEVQPTLLFTFPVGPYVEINPSAKGIIGEDFYYALNFGVGLSTDFKKYVIRPEYGLCFNPGESGHFSQFSIGTTFYFANLFTKKR